MLAGSWAGWLRTGPGIELVGFMIGVGVLGGVPRGWVGRAQLGRSTGGISKDEGKGVIADMKLLELFKLGRWSIKSSNWNCVAAESKMRWVTTMAGFLTAMFVGTGFTGRVKPLGSPRRGF